MSALGSGGALLYFVAHAASHAAMFVVRLAWVFPILIALELLWPIERPSWSSRLRGVGFWAAYILIGSALMVIADPLLSHHPWTLPPLIAAICAVVIGDLLYYWCHRAQHRWFWRFHAVHHSIREMNGVNAYHHWIEELIRLPFTTVPVVLLFPSGTPWILAVASLQTFYLHAPTRLNFGRFRIAVADNRFHRIHHSLEARHMDHNFAATFPLWDVLFGTAYMPRAEEWPKVGLADKAEPQSIVEYLLSGRPHTELGGKLPQFDLAANVE